LNKPDFFDQRGFAIVLVLILCAAIGAASFYLMGQGSETEKKVSGDARVLSYKLLVNAVKAQIHLGNICTNTLQNLNINQAFNNDGMSIELDLKLEMNRKVLRKIDPSNPKDVWFLQGGTSIKDVRLFVQERVFSPVLFDSLTEPPLVAAKGYILIIPGHTGVGVHLPRNRGYRIPIFLYYSVSGGNKTLHSCFDTAGEAAICTASGGAFDYRQEGLMKCQPQLRCLSSKHGIVSDQSLCIQPFKPLLIGYVSGASRYICEWCNVNKICQDSYYLGPAKFFAEKLNLDGSLNISPGPLADPNQVSSGTCN
jgi:hypothetical protein